MNRKPAFLLLALALGLSPLLPTLPPPMAAMAGGTIPAAIPTDVTIGATTDTITTGTPRSATGSTMRHRGWSIAIARHRGSSQMTA